MKNRSFYTVTTLNAAIESCADWYAAVRTNAPWWLGLGLSDQQAGKLWRFVEPWAAQPYSEARSKALRVLRGTDLPEAVTDWQAAATSHAKRQLDSIRWEDPAVLAPGSSAMSQQAWNELGHRSGILGALHPERGRPLRYTDADLAKLHRQAVWLAKQVRQFEPEVLTFGRRFGLSKDDGWAIRFPLLESAFVRLVKTRHAPGNKLEPIADFMVAERSDRTEDHIRTRRYSWPEEQSNMTL